MNYLSRTKKAREIGKKMGLRRIKQESACLDCHFTAMEVGGKEKTVAGITCESCHGAARDWIKIHSDASQEKVGGLRGRRHAESG